MNNPVTMSNLPGRVVQLLTAAKRAASPKALRRRSPVKGYLHVSILYHLRVCGQATDFRLQALIGTARRNIIHRLQKMQEEGLVMQHQPVKAVVWQLTDRGRADAELVDRRDVEFAS